VLAVARATPGILVISTRDEALAAAHRDVTAASFRVAGRRIESELPQKRAFVRTTKLSSEAEKSLASAAGKLPARVALESPAELAQLLPSRAQLPNRIALAAVPRSLRERAEKGKRCVCAQTTRARELEGTLLRRAARIRPPSSSLAATDVHSSVTLGRFYRHSNISRECSFDVAPLFRRLMPARSASRLSLSLALRPLLTLRARTRQEGTVELTHCRDQLSRSREETSNNVRYGALLDFHRRCLLFLLRESGNLYALSLQH
jgi:hypothetical protein